MVLLGACSTVTMTHPLTATGDAVLRDSLEGRWLTDDDVIWLRFTAAGLGRFAGLEWDDDDFQLQVGELVVTEGADGGYLSVRVREDGEWENEYFLVRFHLTSAGDLVLWLPETSVFRAAVEKGVVAGTVASEEHSTSIVLTGPPDEVLAFLEGPHDTPAFDLENPMVLKRLILEADPSD
jgi:hypothetical protein